MTDSRTLSLIIAVVFLVAACGGEADPVDAETPADSDTEITTDSHEDGAPLPLPPPVGEQQEETLPDGTTRVWPNSGEVTHGAPYRITVYTHCGFEPVDFDGSFWELDSGPSNPSEHLEDPLDRGTITLEGEGFTLEGENEAMYTSSTGAEFILRRIDGPIEQNPCE